MPYNEGKTLRVHPQARMKRWKKFLILSLPVAFCLLAAEGGLRLMGIHTPVRVLCFHPVYQRQYCPNTTGILKKNVRVQINNDGLIDRPYPHARQPHTLRVAVLGDSMTAGEEVFPGERYHDLWEQWLPARLGKPVEVINFGVRGFGTWEALQMFHLKIAAYRPDVTVLGFYWGNDIENNLESLHDQKPNPLLNQYSITPWQKFFVKRKEFNKWLWNHSAVYHLSRTGYNWMENEVKNFFTDHSRNLVRFRRHYPNRPEPIGFNSKPAPFSPRDLVNNLESPFDDKFFFDSEGWDLTRNLIHQLNREVRAAGSRLLIIHFLDVDQYHRYPPLPLDLFDRFLGHEGIPHLNLYPAYASLDEATLYANVFPDDSHFNARGHRQLAHWTMDFLISQLLGDANLA